MARNRPAGLLKLFLGLLLVPTSLGAIGSAVQAMGSVAFHAQRTFPFVLGFLGYGLLRAFWIRPVRLYVFGHELSHALAAWLGGAAVLDFHVGRKGGHVDLSHSNAWIALAPYVVPIYSVLVVLIYRLWMWCGPVSIASRKLGYELFLLGMGGTLSFHLAHTAEAVGMTKQPDLRQAGGVIFSLAWIALSNGFVLILAAKCLFPEVINLGHSVWMVVSFTKWFWWKLGGLILKARS